MYISIYGLSILQASIDQLVIPQVAATANQIGYWILGAAGYVNSLVSKQILSFAT